MKESDVDRLLSDKLYEIEISQFQNEVWKTY